MNKLLFPDQLATNRLQLPLALVTFLITVFVFVLISPAYGEGEETPTPLDGEEFGEVKRRVLPFAGQSASPGS